MADRSASAAAAAAPWRRTVEADDRLIKPDNKRIITTDVTTFVDRSGATRKQNRIRSAEVRTGVDR